MSVRLYVGNLPKEVEKQELETVFADAEGVEPGAIKLIVDRKTGKCRGFGFVTVPDDEHADRIIEQLNGHSFKESTLKIEKAQPRKTKEEENGNDGAHSGPTKSSNRRSGAGKKRRPGNVSSSSESVQPDPRWANELEKLKQMLSAQTTNS